VDMDAFFVAVERLDDPGLSGRPVVVGGDGPRSVVAAASYEVRPFGVRSAMPMSRARRLCPGLVIVPPDHRRYAEVSEQVFAVFRSVTPLVEGISIDEAFLDVSGLRLHHRSPVEVGEEVRARVVSEVGLTASVGVASTKFVAKLASEAAKPDGIRHVPVADQQAFLDGLGVGALWGVGQATSAALEAISVETVADLRSVPPRTLERAVGGSASSHLIDLANGRDPRPVEPDRDAKSISVEETYDRDLASDAECRIELRRLSDRLGSRVRRSGMAGRTVTVKVRTADFETVTRAQTLGVAVDGDRELREQAFDLFDRVDLAGRRVRLLGVGLGHLVEASAPLQLGVLTDDRWSDIERTVDAIRGRFGEDAVGRPDPRGASPT